MAKIFDDIIDIETRASPLVKDRRVILRLVFTNILGLQSCPILRHTSLQQISSNCKRLFLVAERGKEEGAESLERVDVGRINLRGETLDKEIVIRSARSR